jgi:hypothetical protein
VQSVLRAAAAAAVTAVCLYFAFRGTEWAEIREVLGRTRYGWVLAMAAVSVVVVYFRALRWRVLLAGVERLPMGPLFSSTAIGFMSNMILPLRAGEIIRPLLLGRQTQVPVSAALASIMLERLFDLLLLFSFMIAISVTVPVPARMQRASYVLAAAIALILALIVLLLRYQAAAMGRIRRGLRRLPGGVGDSIGEILESFLRGVAGVNDSRTVLSLLGYSLAVWTVIAATFGFGILALDLEAPLVAGSISLMVIVAAFVSLPQAPGFVGTWQAGCVAALAFYGVTKDEAIGYSLVTHVVQLLVNVGLGGICLFGSHTGLRELATLAQRDTGER